MFADQFVTWANGHLDQSDKAQEYLLGRGISKEQWGKHKIGFVGGEFDVDPTTFPDHSDVCSDFEKKHIWCDACHYRSWSATWEAPAEGERKVRHVGRRITGGVVFPLTSYSGKTIGFQVRSLDRKAYDTFAIRRRPEGYFFGVGPNMDSIWHSREILLVEGPVDQLIMERLVRPNVVAITTSSLGILQIRFLERFVRRIYMCLDSDKAGRIGTQNFIKKYGSNFDIIDVKYQMSGMNCKDVGDMWKIVGDDRFRGHMARVFS